MLKNRNARDPREFAIFVSENVW